MRVTSLVVGCVVIMSAATAYAQDSSRPYPIPRLPSIAAPPALPHLTLPALPSGPGIAAPLAAPFPFVAPTPRTGSSYDHCCPTKST